MKRLIDRGNSSLLIEMSGMIGNVLNDDTNGNGDGDDCVLHIQQDEDFYRMDFAITSIRMNDGLCNESVMSEWDLSVYPNLKELTVGDDCIRYMSSVVLSGFACLEKVAIGCNCGSSAAGGRFELAHCGQSAEPRIKYADWSLIHPYPSIAREISSSISVSLGTPAASNSLGYMEMDVKPGMVLISLNTTSSPS